MKTWLAGTASSIGDVAWEICSRAQTALVAGVTSRGVFVRTAPDRVIFVSLETYRSPLTITLADPIVRLRSLAIGAPVQVSDSRLVFPSIEIAISLSADAIWHCPLPDTVSRPRTEQVDVLGSITQAVLSRRDSVGLAILLPALLDQPNASSLSAEHSAMLDRLIAVRQAIRMDDSQQMIAGATSLIGQGRGLTPSGDDVVIGLLLMLNRWHGDRDWSAFNRAAVATAYRATTTISANLIECAADGQGDERLLTVVDGIATSSASIDECVACVLSWGSSSGIDALVGMAIVVTAF